MSDQTLAIAPLEWARINDIHEVEPLHEEDLACLADIRAVLAKHGKCDRFGVTLVHRHFDLAEDEVMLESTDIHNRVLTVRPVKRHLATNAIETSWLFSEDDPPVLGRRCQRHCYRSDSGEHTKHWDHLR